MRRYWCLSTSAENWQICKANHVWGLDSRYLVTLQKFLQAGDRAVVYSHGGRFVAVVEFEGDHFYSEEPIGWTKGKAPYLFPYRIKFKVLTEAHMPPEIRFSMTEEGLKGKWTRPNLIDEIVFIADKGRTWNQYVQVSLIALTEQDFETISAAIEQSVGA